MSKFPDQFDVCSEDVHLLAMLYAGGLLENDQAASFEKMLATDQATRDALADAAAQLHSANRHEPVKPSGKYREKIREKIRPRKTVVGIVAGKKRLRGDPMIWILIGAAVAILLVVGITFIITPGAGPHHTAIKSPVGSPSRLRSFSIEVPFEVESADGMGVANPRENPLFPNFDKNNRGERLFIIDLTN